MPSNTYTTTKPQQNSLTTTLQPNHNNTTTADKNEMNDEELLRRFRQIGLTEEQVASASAIAAELSAFDRGELFCSTEDVFGVEWQPYQAEDFAELRRDWIVYKETLTGTPVLARVYSRTRDSASDPEHHAAFSSSVMSVGENLRIVRLCSFSAANDRDDEHADKAHLCPKTGILGKADTWLYAASAVLGLGFASQAERVVLSKAIRGSCPPGRQVVQHTGLNRSHFNLLLFMEQERYFDKSPGVIVLPVFDVEEAKAWRGEAYSVIILCTSRLNITSAQMAGRIGLNATDREFVKRASNTDLRKAAGLLTTVVKASAYCLENLEPPENERARGLWDRYRDSLSLTRGNVETISGRQNGELEGCVGVPTTRNIPDDSKFIAKVNLANMAPSNGTPAYPDPILVAYKSSVNWTRLWQFQLMAEAEPTDPEYHVPSDNGAGSDVGGRSEHSIPDEVFVS